MHNFDVSVKNESTGEVRIVQVTSAHEADAQVLALLQLFRAEDWRNATAMRPVLCPVEVEA